MPNVDGAKGLNHTSAWFDMQMRRIQNVESQEASERNMDEIKKDIEARANEAMQPVDESGEPIANIASQPTSASPTPAPVPAPAPEVQSAAPVSPSATVYPLPEASISSALSAPSIDITV